MSTHTHTHTHIHLTKRVEDKEFWKLIWEPTKSNITTKGWISRTLHQFQNCGLQDYYTASSGNS